MEQEIEIRLTKMDDNFDEIQRILEDNGVTLEMAMAKLLELKLQNSEKSKRSEESD